MALLLGGCIMATHHPQGALSRRALLQAGVAGALGAAAAGAEGAQESSKTGRPGREIWIASLTTADIHATTREDLVAKILDRMEQVASVRPDLICLPEAFPSRIARRPPSHQAAEPITGPTITAIAAFAKAKRCYVVAPITRDCDGKLFNTAVLLDRDGRVAGLYDKLHPTEGELAGGINPGRAAPVFTTDFGKIGIQICFDIGWPDGWKTLKDGGAELVVWPSAYPGGFPLNAFAWTHRYAIVTSTWTLPSVLIDIDGRTLASSGTWEPWFCASFCLDRGLFHYDFNQSKVREVEKAYGRDVTVRWSHDENAFVLENRVPGKTLADLCEEFGLVPMDAYLARAATAQEKARG
jgi:beta-ureidopropionase